MRALLCGLGLAAAIAAFSSPAYSSSRASVTTSVLPANSALSAVPFRPDSAPTPDSTTYLQFVSICPWVGCSGRGICTTDSIRIELGGNFPDDCYFVRSIEVDNSPGAPGPVLRVLVDDGACPGRACNPVRTPWTRSIGIAPLPKGDHVLTIAVARVHCPQPIPSQPSAVADGAHGAAPGDTIPPPTWRYYTFSFRVSQCDSTPPINCLRRVWEHATTRGACEATITPTEPAHVTMKLTTSVALAGLQGTFMTRPHTLKITDIRPTGAAAGMKLTWAGTDSGARFVMFTDANANIAPADTPVPVIALTLAVAADVPIPPITQLEVFALLGSDPEGNAVRQCYRIEAIYDPPARICAAADCDANHDGLTDVRDLVVMMRCITGLGLCTELYDCNGDSAATVDDVLCCAWNVLRSKPCRLPEGCPGDSVEPRHDEAVHVTVGTPVEVAEGIRIPIRIDGADRIGAARLAMSFPTDRWFLDGLEGGDASWLTLVGVDKGKAVMGAIRLSPAPAAGPLELSLKLRPIVGAPSGGTLGALEADVSAADGVKLIVPVTAPSRPLPGGATVELSGNRPDPFSGVTHFTLSLPKAAAVDLAVFDLNGRRVTTLHHGPLAAGVTEFTWNGRTERGDRAHGGVYFYRAIVGGQAVSRRMVFLGSR